MNKAIEYIKNYWSEIGIFSSLVVLSVVSVLMNFSELSIGADLYLPFLVLVILTLVLILLEIRSFALKKEQPVPSYKNMNDARDDIFEKISKRMKKRHLHTPVVLRVYGMRLSHVSDFLLGFMTYFDTNYHVRHRKLDIFIYHCDPEFLTDKKTKPYGKPVEVQVRVQEKFKLQVENLEKSIGGLMASAERYPWIDNIHFKKYSSFPSFWAYEIDERDIFWGYFTWSDEAENWIGAENKCFYFNEHNQPIDGLTDWIHNQFDGLEAWAKNHDD